MSKVEKARYRLIPGTRNIHAVVKRAVKGDRPPSRPDCGRSERFKGTKDPRCNGGYGCYACWRKRILFLDDGVR